VNKHPLADHVRILARGKHASRNMTAEEAQYTMSMFLKGECEPEQIGAVFMLLRVLEETSDEIAGFAKAINAYWPAGAEQYDLVWSSFAGKRRQPMWWVLSALLLTQMGYRILVHGTLSHTEGRVYAHEVFSELGLVSLTKDTLASSDAPLAYLPCSEIHPVLQQWLALKSVLGVRSPINTVLKTIAPAHTPSVQGVFHPNYKAIHAGAAQLNEDHLMVIKGEGGEFEVNPERKCVATYSLNQELGEITIPNQKSHFENKPDSPDSDWLKKVWKDEYTSDYADEAILATAALALCAIQKNHDYEKALSECKSAWQVRDRELIK
jgi:anthranilate phosphoribosyltransferase